MFKCDCFKFKLHYDANLLYNITKSVQISIVKET